MRVLRPASTLRPPVSRGFGSGGGGIGWRIPLLPFQRALMVYADSKTMKEFKDKT